MAARCLRSVARLLMLCGCVLGILLGSTGAVAADASRGRTLFNGSTPYGCAICHSGTPTSAGYPGGNPLSFTGSWAGSTANLIATLRTQAGVMASLGNSAANANAPDHATAVRDVDDLYAHLINERNLANQPDAIISPVAGTVALNSSLTFRGNTSMPLNKVTYRWSLRNPAGVSFPRGTAATETVTFTSVGTYRITLFVESIAGGAQDSASVDVTVVAPLPVPFVAAIASSVVAGQTVNFDGSGSTPVSAAYTWMVTAPNGGTTALSGSRASFTPTVVGTYSVTLTVSANGRSATSAPRQFTVTAPPAPANTPPVARATGPTTGMTGMPIALSGRTSTDADPGDMQRLTYAWVLDTSKIPGSAAVLGGAATQDPTFTPDRPGVYTATLTVSDGNAFSAPASVTVNVTTSGSPFGISSVALEFTAALGASDVQSTVISNKTPGTPLLLNGLTFDGAAKSEYALAADNTCVVAAPIPVNGCTLAIRFTPAAVANPRDAQLSIAYGAPDSPQLVLLRGRATPTPQGLILVGASSLVFPDTQIGTSASVSTTVRNGGDRALVFTAFTPGGAAAGDFRRGGTCSLNAPLAVGASCTVTIDFQPVAEGSREATLSILSDASNGTATLALAGTGLLSQTPLARLSPAPLDFGAQTVGGLYPARRLTLSNAGVANLTGISVAVQGTGFTPVDAASCPAILQTGETCDIDVAFAPLAAQTDYAGTVRVTSNAASVAAALSGRGVATTVPVLLWAPAVARLDFGQVIAGTVSPERTVTLRNQGPGGVEFRLVNAVGVDASAFPVTAGTCPITSPLYQGAECDLAVRFAPGSSGDKRASIQLVSSGSLPTEIVLAGTGLAGPNPELAVSATSLDFGTVRIGAQSVPQELTLSNGGSGVLTVSALQATGAFALQNKTCGAPPFALQAGASCAVALVFAPSSAGAASGVLRVTSDAWTATREVALAGSGEAQPGVSGGGGCSVVPGDTLADPTLWTLVLLAVAVLARRARSRRGRDPRRRA